MKKNLILFGFGLSLILAAYAGNESSRSRKLFEDQSKQLSNFQFLNEKAKMEKSYFEENLKEASQV